MAKEIPLGVKIISILYYISAALLAVSAIVLFVGSGTVASFFANIPILSILGAVGAGLFIFVGIMCLLFGVLSFFIGRGLWKLKSWARVLVIVLSCLGVLMGLIGLANISVGGVVQLLINGAIGGYLIFSKEVKKAFK